jgi:histidinol phosphatase-like PHP family hydrolase
MLVFNDSIRRNAMNSFKYEMHTHTNEVSRCASIPADELVQFYKDQGFSGVCITDHFLNGNTRVPKDLSWAEQVELFCEGYEKALLQGQKIGIDVFFGWEYSYHGSDFLTYGLDKNWPLNHPEVMELSVNAYLDLVRSEGGLVMHAHPFRESSYIEMIRLFPRRVDGIEIINANRKDFENERAEEFAKNYDLLQIAGSDNHHGHQERLSGIRLARPVSDGRDLIDAIQNKETEVFIEYL